MKSCWIKTENDKTTLEFRDIPVPQPKPGEIVVRAAEIGRASCRERV